MVTLFAGFWNVVSFQTLYFSDALGEPFEDSYEDFFDLVVVFAMHSVAPWYTSPSIRQGYWLSYEVSDPEMLTTRH